METRQLVKKLLEDGVLVGPQFIAEVEGIDDYSVILDLARRKKKSSETTVAVNNYKYEPKKVKYTDFVDMFTRRYEFLQKLLLNRNELIGVRSIERIKKKDTVSIIGMIREKKRTKNNHIIATLEDPTGTIDVLVKSDDKNYNTAKDLLNDEIIGVRGMGDSEMVFAERIIFPDIPSSELKKCDEEVYAAFVSDIHVGSNEFLEGEFLRFIDWLNSQPDIKYIFIAGDLVDGISVYPNQEVDLAIKNIYDQYSQCAEYLSKISEDKKLIICAGNHDAVRLEEPQPVLSPDYAKDLYLLPNAVMTTNPAMINIHANDSFSGFNVLMYHGYSYDYYAQNVESIRSNGGYDSGDLIMKFLLQRRHLAPTHSSTVYLPDTNTDPLLIDKVPDFFVSGHIHKSVVSNYRGVTLILGSCFQSKTAYQEKVGHHPEPCRVPIVNLKTRGVKIMDFSNSSTQP